MTEGQSSSSANIQLRPLTLKDMPLAMELKTIAGWNQLPSDWEFLINTGGGGNFVATCNGKEAGTATTITYQDRFSWIGMVLVDPAFRGKGVGTVLLNEAIAYARQKGTVRLDATPQGEKLYKTMGFVAERNLMRYERLEQPGPLPELSQQCSPVTERIMNEIIDADTPIFGADRGSVLQYLHNISPEYAYYLKKGGRITGYCFGRSGSNFEQIGPVIAENTDDAKDLLSTALASCSGKRVIMDVFTENIQWLDFIGSLGFKTQRPYVRMYLGDLKHPGNTVPQYAIAGAELG
ncbi:MAG: GNAT family N-acetyltransferase [Balneolales bacterium]